LAARSRSSLSCGGTNPVHGYDSGLIARSQHARNR
jgi:hypothetical protein